MLELTALPSIRQEAWLPLLEAADALLVGGGASFYLCSWMHQTELASMPPSLLQEKVYVGAGAGSILVTSTFSKAYNGIDPPMGSDKTLGLVDFALRAHLDADYMPAASLANIETWAAGVTVPVYAI